MWALLRDEQSGPNHGIQAVLENVGLGGESLLAKALPLLIASRCCVTGTLSSKDRSTGRRNAIILPAYGVAFGAIAIGALLFVLLLDRTQALTSSS